MSNYKPFNQESERNGKLQRTRGPSSQLGIVLYVIYPVLFQSENDGQWVGRLT